MSNIIHTHADQHRRNLLKGLAAAAVAATMPGRLFAAEAGPTAVVIGAGIGGLSAAWELLKAGFQVSIFEKEKYTGGRMVELQMGPLYQFTHAQMISGDGDELFSLADEAGISDQLAQFEFGKDQPRQILERGLLNNGHGLYDLPSIWELAFNPKAAEEVPGLSAATKQRLPLLQADLRAARDAVDTCQARTAAAFDDESLGHYYERLLGKQVVGDFLPSVIQPYCEWWGWPPYETSKAALLPQFTAFEAAVLPKGGIGALTRKLDSLLPVQNNTTVRYITPPDADGRHTVHYLNANMERRIVTPDVVVCAVEAKYLDKIIQKLTPKQNALAKSSYFSKEAVICYMLDDKHAPKEYSEVNYTTNHPDPLKAKTTTAIATPRIPALNFPPHVRFVLSRTDTANWQKSGQTIDDYCFPLAQDFHPALDKKHVVDIVNYTCDDLIFMPVGYAKKMNEVLLEQEKSKRGMYFAGEYLAGAHTAAACSSGRTVGRCIAKHWA